MNDAVHAGLHGAFMAAGFHQSPPTPAAVAPQRLEGVRLAVKDVFDVAGLTTGAGNPTWLSEQSPAARTAWAVQRLLEQGCQWVGKTLTDELTYSLAGINAHYGTPINPAAPERLPGGSSSGSAVAVAGGYADLALGTDCGGSIRLPASYCGLWGLRPTHGQVWAEGCFTLAASFDTVGWFARDAVTLCAALQSLVGTAPLPRMAPGLPATRLCVSEDVLALLDAPVREAFEAWLRDHHIAHQRLPAGTLALEQYAQAFRVLQGAEIWRQHGGWVSRTRAPFGADVAARFAAARDITTQQINAAQLLRIDAQEVLAEVLRNGQMLLLPPVPGPAPRLDATPAEVDETRRRSQQLLCMAGLAGLPQVVMPWTGIDKAPVGLSLIGAPQTDAALLGTAQLLFSGAFASPAQTHGMACAEHPVSAQATVATPSSGAF